MPPLSANDGISRQQILEWVESGFDIVLGNLQDHFGGDILPNGASISPTIREQRGLFQEFIEHNCPPIVRRCEELESFQRDVDGFFKTVQKARSTPHGRALLDVESREYKRIANQIRQVLAGMERKKPNVFPRHRFDALWSRLCGGKEEGLPLPKEVSALFNRPGATERILVAKEIIDEEMKYIVLDLPGEITNWLYLRHFRRDLERMFDLMESVLHGCEAYARVHRNVYLHAMDVIEDEVKQHYELPEDDEYNSAQEPMIWRSALQRVTDEAQAMYGLDYDAKRSLDAFYETELGHQFGPEYRAIIEDFPSLGPRITRQDLMACKEKLTGWLGPLDELVERYFVPALSRDFAQKMREAMRRKIVAVIQVSETLFQKEEEKWKSRTSSVNAPEAEGQSKEEAAEFPKPTIGKWELFMIHQHISELNKFDEDFEQKTVHFLEAYPDLKLGFSKAWMRYRISLDKLFRDLPAILDIGAFRDFINRCRDALVPFERAMRSVNREIFHERADEYVRCLDEVEGQVGEIFSLQVSLNTSHSVIRPEPHTEVAQAFEGIDRQDVLAELQKANTAADKIYNAAMTKAGSELRGGSSGFEDVLQKAVEHLCPEKIVSLKDMEKIIFWLIGRIQGIEEASSKESENWHREINRTHFEGALRRIYQKFPLSKDQRRNVRLSKEILNLLTEAAPSHRNQHNGKGVSREHLLEEILVGLQRAETRVIPTVGRKTKMSEQQKGLKQYFATLRNSLSKFVHEWCPEIILSDSPLIAVDAFLSELSYSSRAWIIGAATASEAHWYSVMAKINEAFVTTLELHSLLLRSEQGDVQSLGEQCEIGTIRNVSSGKQEEEDGTEESDGKQKLSDTLHVDLPYGFVQALFESILLDKDYLQKQITDVCRAAEKTLPDALSIPNPDKETLLRVIWWFRRLGLAIAEHMTTQGPMQHVEQFEQFFGGLGVLVDKVKNQYRGNDLHQFLREQFLRSRGKIQEQICHEYAQKQMQAAVTAQLGKEPSALQYHEFFLQYAHFLFAERCRRFLYSCVLPSSSKEELKDIGVAVDTTTGMLLMNLTERINALCKAAKNGIPTLRELQQCLKDFASSVDLKDLSVPAGTEARFKQEVLDALIYDVKQFETPHELFHAYTPPKLTENLERVIDNETDVLIRVQEDDELAALLHTAREDHQVSREYLEQMSFIIQSIEGKQDQQDVLIRITAAAHALKSSLYAEFMEKRKKSEKVSVKTLPEQLRPLVDVLDGLQRCVHDPRNRSLQRKAIHALQQFSETLRGLLHSLPLLP